MNTFSRIQTIAFIFIWITNIICYYTWWLASNQFGYFPRTSSTNDPASLGLNESYHAFVDWSVIIGIICFIYLFGFVLKKRTELSIANKIFSILSLIIFIIILFGGFLFWWTD